MKTEGLVLIDTSSWIEALRRTGSKKIQDRVRELMLEGLAAWCDIIRVELWNGARGDYERKTIAELEEEIICLETTKEVWALARLLAQECRKKGITVPVSDLIISSCSLHYIVPLEHCDTHIKIILKTREGVNGKK
ncbi:MAG: hypothetical protein A2161_13320 [Candidatus Schekmanbacteria bacterium RBG_13_48_7]|uniref:PIN domain-containing protein n=1 Tax=Candidatus Schekmanbacteria bacterium RBG_13_48_7 TaxID=1817878 RepID=A0A1F7S4X0_9BACT|nr:MAG: hypothetical protein A2161_13320 [Candidatus Schekmanbacteria bacterium RBG_13_48_7]